MPSIREMDNSPYEQGVNEQISYWVDTTILGGNPVGSVCTLTVLSTDTDVTATKMPGAATVNGNRINSPLVIGLTVNTVYRLHFRWTTPDSNVLEYYGDIKAVR